MVNFYMKLRKWIIRSRNFNRKSGFTKLFLGLVHLESKILNIIDKSLKVFRLKAAILGL